MLTAAALFASLLRLAAPTQITESVTVTAGATRVAAGATATVIGREAVAASPVLAVDQMLGTTPGFSLFRRTPSRAANPTTQGVTLRGLAASGASRTLVLVDDEPLNDPFGGWIYWNRVPVAAIDDMVAIRGGASALYGSDALGGAIRIGTRRDRGGEVRIEGGNRATARVSLYGGTGGRAGASGGAEWLTSDNYIPLEPDARGAVDTPAAWRYSSAVGRVGRHLDAIRLDAGGSFLSERRNNGTALQTNKTRIGAGHASAAGEAAGGFWSARLSLADQRYDQTFSAVAAGRASERLVNVQQVDSRAWRGSASWARVAANLTWLADVSARRVTADLTDSRGLIAATQHAEGAGLQVHWTPGTRVTLSAGGRAEVWTSVSEEGEPGEKSRIGLVGARASVSTRLSDAATVRVTVSDAYRPPTINELYRGFRVGDVTTLPNASLGPEDALGGELAFTVSRGRWTMRAAAFAAGVDGAIYSRTLPTIAPGTLRMRDNGHARSTGVELEVDGRARDWLTVWAGISTGRATFTSGELDGNTLPQVPRWQAAAGVRAARGRWLLSADTRAAGAQFDDDKNAFELAPAATANVLAAVRWRGARLFVAVENLFDARAEAGRTPLLTQGPPRMWRVGVRVGRGG